MPDVNFEYFFRLFDIPNMICKEQFDTHTRKNQISSQTNLQLQSYHVNGVESCVWIIELVLHKASRGESLAEE